jgi:hypothetical protein
MARTTRASKAGGRASEAFSAARENPYVQRLVEDAELRQNLRDAYDAARSAYGRVTRNGKKPAKAIGDKKVQKDLRSAADSLRTASEQIRAAPKRKRGGIGKLLVIGAVGAGVTLALSENARKAVMDRLFGAEEEFEYTSTTSTSTGSTDGSGS